MYIDSYRKRMYDREGDVISVSFQTLDGNILKMAAPTTVFMCESLTILEFFF